MPIKCKMFVLGFDAAGQQNDTEIILWLDSSAWYSSKRSLFWVFELNSTTSKAAAQLDLWPLYSETHVTEVQYNV